MRSLRGKGWRRVRWGLGVVAFGAACAGAGSLYVSAGVRVKGGEGRGGERWEWELTVADGRVVVEKEDLGGWEETLQAIRQMWRVIGGLREGAEWREGRVSKAMLVSEVWEPPFIEIINRRGPSDWRLDAERIQVQVEAMWESRPIEEGRWWRGKVSGARGVWAWWEGLVERPGEVLGVSRGAGLRSERWSVSLAGVCGVSAGALVLGWGVGRLRERWRMKEGCCVRCGYDLRASPAGCPECGWGREGSLEGTSEGGRGGGGADG